MSSQASISALSFCRLLEIDVHNMLAKVQKKNLPPMRLENCRLSVSMVHACGLYVSCLLPLSTTHGYDKGRIAFWGARKRLGALAVLCGFERWACKHRAVRRAWNIGAGFVLLDSCFSVVLFVVRFSGSFFWSFFSWLVLLVRAFGRPFRGSCFWSFFGFVLLVVLLWFVLLVRAFGGSYVFFVRCFKFLRGVCGKVRGFLMQR